MELMGIAGVAGITVICYLVGVIIKATPWNNNKIIPIACGITGAILHGHGRRYCVRPGCHRRRPGRQADA